MSLQTPSQFVSHKWFHQCVNHKKKLSLRHFLPTFGSFSFFQATIWLGVDKELQKLTKSYKSGHRHLFQCCILIPRKCLCKTTFQHTVALSLCTRFSNFGFRSLFQTWKKIEFKTNLIFFSSLNLISTACVACKNQFRNQIDFSVF